MANNTQIVSVSAPITLCKFIEEANLSASQIFQEAIIEKKQIWDNLHNNVVKLEKAKEVLQQLILEQSTFMEEKGIYEEFNKWRGEWIRSHPRDNAVV